jgi:hydrogenase small subunit
MIISRRQFIKYCSIAAGALGLNATDLMKIEKATAATGGLPVIWIAGQACTGCTTSLANSVYYQTIQELLLLGTASTTLDLKVCETLMASMSNEATQQATLTSSGFALVVEGAIPATGVNTPKAGYCTIGSYTGAASEDVGAVVSYLAHHSNCAAILTVGTCSSYGGIPAGAGNITGAKGVLSYLGPNNTDANGHRYRSKTICIPGCPPNPNWIVGTVAYLLANGLAMPALDSLRRPRTYYGQRICNSCDRFPTSLTGQFAGFVGMDSNNSNSAMRVTQPEMIGDPVQNTPGGRCLKKAGCKGSRTKSDCSLRKWHSPGFMQAGVNWCVGAGAPCQGCTQNYFPDGMSPFHYIR